MAASDINQQTLFRLLDRVKHEINKIESMTFEPHEILSDEDIQDLVDRRFQVAIEACIDIAVIIVAAMQLPRKEEAADVFRVLGKQKVLDVSLAEKMAKAVGFRNILAHEYEDIDYESAYGGLSIKEKLDDLREFAKAVVEVLEKK